MITKTGISRSAKTSKQKEKQCSEKKARKKRKSYLDISKLPIGPFSRVHARFLTVRIPEQVIRKISVGVTGPC